jgi:DNA/RNA-binding domain of Phe-tRNA-synthetase-like protein
MDFLVREAVFERFPGMSLAVAVATDVDNRAERPELTRIWEETWAAARAAEAHGNAQSHPRVRPWRERFKAMGVSGKEFPSSIEALLRRALKGGAPVRINPLVDFYNAVSLRHVVPAGGFDLEAMPDPLELRLTREGDEFLALDADKPLHVPPGEVGYMTGRQVLTRHFVWRQARTALILEPTARVMLVSEVLGELGGNVLEAVLEDFRSGLKELFGVSPLTFVVTEERSAISW